MISFEQFAAQDGTPVYLQLLRYIKRAIAAGTVCDGDELPSRRVLSALLGLNPNTVQKVYRMLEEEGLVQSHAGAKSCMVLDAARVEQIRAELLEEDARRVVRAMQEMGISKETAIGLIQRYWE